MNKKIFSILCVLCIFILIVAFFFPQKDRPKNKQQTVCLNEVAHSIFYAPLYVAIERDYFKAEGIDLELTTGFGADKTMTAVLSDHALIGLMGPETTLYTYQEGITDPVINFAQLTQRAGNFLIARKPASSFDWSDLNGRTILGGRKGGMPEMVLEYILLKNHIDPQKDLTIDQSIDFGSTASAFSNGLGDYTVEFEPAASMLEAQGTGSIVCSLGVDSGYLPYTTFCAKESRINTSPELFRSFCRALQNGVNDCFQLTSKEIASIIAPQFPEITSELLETVISRYKEQDTWKRDLIFSERSYTLLVDVLKNSDPNFCFPDFDQIIDTSFARESFLSSY